MIWPNVAKLGFRAFNPASTCATPRQMPIGAVLEPYLTNVIISSRPVAVAVVQDSEHRQNPQRVSAQPDRPQQVSAESILETIQWGSNRGENGPKMGLIIMA